MSSKGSGLSLERFIRGKARPNKGNGETTSGKRKRVEKAVLLRNYRKVKEKEPSVSAQGTSNSFYDKFFSQVKDGNDDNSDEDVKRKSTHRPDPLFKAKQKAQQVKDERIQKKKVIEQKLKEKEKKVVQRKKRHVKLSLRTKTGQPVVKHQMKDILAKLKKST